MILNKKRGINIRYIGSKNRISKEVVPIIQRCIDDNNIKTYFEPFVGGANMIDKIKCNRRIGNDIHKELIALFKQLQTGWKPPIHISEDEYNDVRLNRDKYPDYYVGFVGFNATFGNKYFGGYARSPKSDGDRKRDRPNESIRNMMEQVPNIQDIKFICDDYLTLNETNMNDWVIYCDPPYKGTTKYATDGFEYDTFWQWVRDTSKNNFVFVSEYNAPEDFECIWSKECQTLLDSNKITKDVGNIRTEKLFVHNKGLSHRSYL